MYVCLMNYLRRVVIPVSQWTSANLLTHYPEFLHRQCFGLAYTRGRVFESRLLQQVVRFVSSVYKGNTWSSGGTPHEGGSAASQLDLPSLTPLSIAGCGRLQL